MHRTLLIAGCLALLLARAEPAGAGDWGALKGRVVWAAAELPKKVRAAVDRDQEDCLKKGPIYRADYVVDARSRGVRWVLVHLQHVKSPELGIPIHPSLRPIPKQPLVIDTPCCEYEPRVAAVREGQPVVVRNSSKLPHNIFWQGGLLGPRSGLLQPQEGGELRVPGIKARLLPVPYTCSIHSWMKGYVGVFEHPYFAVTDENGNFEIKNAPAGKFRLLLWQETKGWVILDPRNPKDRGLVIEIKADGTTDLGKIDFQPFREER